MEENLYNHVEKRERKSKKNKIARPEKIIHAIKNKDKVGHEEWDDQRVKNIANFPSPARILLLGSCGTGKSTVIKNLIIQKYPRFEEVYLIHEDAEFTKEYDDLDCTMKLSEVPPLNFWEYEGKHIRRAVIVDDLELTSANKERLKNLAIMFRYASTHKGLTIYFAHQSFFDILNLIKKMSNVFILWKPRAYSELTMIENRVGLPKHTLKELFKTIATGHRDSICVDLTENSPAKLRLNIFQKIEVESDSESD
jgi:ABC-type cobalamin/Fe3+-siderophores transport system ATPase subunit